MPKQGFISASKVGVILKNGKGQTFTVGAITYAEEIAQQVIGVKPEPDFKSFDMERGIENEWLVFGSSRQLQFSSTLCLNTGSSRELCGFL